MGDEFGVGEWLVQQDLNRLSSGDRSVQLEPKVIEVLIYLAEHAGEVLPKEKILHAVWSGTYISDEVLIHSISELRRALGDDERNPRFIQTVPRRGYRLIAPVMWLAPEGASQVQEVIIPPLQSLRKPCWQPGLHAVLAVAVVVAFFSAFTFFIRQRLAMLTSFTGERVVLVVLPFENLSGDGEQDSFSDGLTEVIIAQLGGLRPERLRVIALTAAMQYKGTRKPADQIGRELGVNYILEGTVRREEGRVRVNAQLVRVSDQSQLWAEGYDRELSGILEVQTDIARAVTKRVDVTLSHKN